MDKEKVKLIVRNIELLVESLKKEISFDEEFEKFEIPDISINDYDEIFENDDE